MSKFRIMMSSDIDYEDLCAEIYFENDFFAIINQEKGFDNLEIDIAACPNNKEWSFSYAELLEILAHAKERLKLMQKITDSEE